MEVFDDLAAAAQLTDQTAELPDSVGYALFCSTAILFLSVAIWSIVVVIGRLWGYAVAYDLTVSWSRWILAVCEKVCRAALRR